MEASVPTADLGPRTVRSRSWYERVFEAGIRPVSIGGDHSITWPILRAARATRFPEPVGMIHFLDPAYAPAVADPEVDDLTTREVMGLVQGVRGLDLFGADIVCFTPPLDNPAQITALTISSLMLEMVTSMADYLASRRLLLAAAPSAD